MNQLCCIFGKRVNASSYTMEISEAGFCFVIVSVVFPAAEKKRRMERQPPGWCFCFCPRFTVRAEARQKTNVIASLPSFLFLLTESLEALWESGAAPQQNVQAVCLQHCSDAKIVMRKNLCFDGKPKGFFSFFLNLIHQQKHWWTDVTKIVTQLDEMLSWGETLVF